MGEIILVIMQIFYSCAFVVLWEIDNDRDDVVVV